VVRSSTPLTGQVADSIAAFAAALREAVARRRLAVIDCVVDSSEYWEQMSKPGSN
jgi:thiamine pyrophosphate-dependent acetolactate synthase large subunit-like protein